MPIALEKYELLFVHPIVLKCLKSWRVGEEMLVVGSMQNYLLCPKGILN
jgi:hypothetical protein